MRAILAISALALAGCGSVNVGSNAQQCMGYDQDGCIPICFADASCPEPPIQQATIPSNVTAWLTTEELYVGEQLYYDGTIPVYYAGPVDDSVPSPIDMSDGFTANYYAGEPTNPTVYLQANWNAMVNITWPDGTAGTASLMYLTLTE